jgi:hypothetical protein
VKESLSGGRRFNITIRSQKSSFSSRVIYDDTDTSFLPNYRYALLISCSAVSSGVTFPQPDG